MNIEQGTRNADLGSEIFPIKSSIGVLHKSEILVRSSLVIFT